MRIASLGNLLTSGNLRKFPALLVVGLLTPACSTLSEGTSAEPQDANTGQFAAWDRKAAPDIGTQLHNPFRKSKKGAVPEITNR